MTILTPSASCRVTTVKRAVQWVGALRFYHRGGASCKGAARYNPGAPTLSAPAQTPTPSMHTHTTHLRGRRAHGPGAHTLTAPQNPDHAPR